MILVLPLLPRQPLQRSLLIFEFIVVLPVSTCRRSFVFDSETDNVTVVDMPLCGFFGEPNLGSAAEAYVEYIAPEQVRHAGPSIRHPLVFTDCAASTADWAGRRHPIILC